jgi:nitrite reductase/ring-hydroxylating ferredoxin subunit
LGPLEAAPLDAAGCVRCPWHGYRFDVCTGRDTDGHGLTLHPAPRVHLDERGRVVLRMP